MRRSAIGFDGSLANFFSFARCLQKANHGISSKNFRASPNNA
jgi:hypothetical protein